MCAEETKEGEQETHLPKPAPKLAMSAPMCVDEIPETKADEPKLEITATGQIDVLPEYNQLFVQETEIAGKLEGMAAPGVEFSPSEPPTGVHVGEQPAGRTQPGSSDQLAEPGRAWAERVEPKDKINVRKPMVFVGGVSASTTPIELVNELRSQGFNVTVLPRIRYGVSFGFCPDLVLSSEAEVTELLERERVWVKDRWVDIRPYIPKEDAVPTPAATYAPLDADIDATTEYLTTEDLLATPFSQASNTPPMLHRSPTGSYIPVQAGVVTNDEVQHPYVHMLPQFGYNPQFSPHVVNFPMFYPQHSPEMPMTFPLHQELQNSCGSHPKSPMSNTHPLQQQLSD